MKSYNKIQKFMYGRYGVDELNKFLLWLYIFLLIFDLFLNNIVLTILELLTILIIVYRSFSRKIYKRSSENKVYLRLRRNLKKPFEVIEKNIKDKNHVYKKCLKCKTILKLPLPDKRGFKHTKCPTCKRKITLFTLKKQKIEIIKN